MLFLITTLLIFFSYYILAIKLKEGSLSGRFVIAGILSCAQIILSQLVLGMFGVLYLPVLAVLNLTISVIVILYSTVKGEIHNALKRDLRIIKTCKHELLAWENIILIAAGLFVSVWMFLSAYHLPPRGIDDLTYHLPPIFEYIVTHKISLLPIELRHCFAFPQNAEFLMMWPAVFFHSQKWVDLTQYVVALFGTGVIYALARMLGNGVRRSFFIGILFIFTPVVLHQSGSCYIDVITGVFLLAGIYFAARFYRDRRLLYLYSAALTIGLMTGMKYHMILFALALQIFILPGLLRKNKRHWGMYFFIIFIAGGYWYVRNQVVIGEAFYPFSFFRPGWGLSAHEASLGFFHLLFLKAYALYVGDTGLGSFCGGYGLVYWGVGFPSWAIALARSFKRAARGEYFHLIFWGQAIAGFILLFLLPLKELLFSPRFSLFIVPVGLLAMGGTFDLLGNRKTFISIIKGLCVAFSILAVTLLFVSNLPHFRLDSVFANIAAGRNPSELTYLRQAGGWLVPRMRPIGEPLDYITREADEGLTCYIVSDKTSFWATNFYGSNLQNRIWNFQKAPDEKPDICVFQSLTDDRIIYVGSKIKPLDIVTDPAYMQIIQLEDAQVFIKEDVLMRKGRGKLLKEYYRENYPFILKSAENFGGLFEKEIPVVTVTSIGYILRYLELDKKIKNKVYWIPQEYEMPLIDIHSWEEVYTFNHTLIGYTAERVAAISINGDEKILYINKKQNI